MKLFRFFLFGMLLSLGTSSATYALAMKPDPLDTVIHKCVYGDPDFMVRFLPNEYDGHTPLPDDIAQGNNVAYFRMNYAALANGKYKVYYSKKKEKVFLEGYIHRRKPKGNWTYYYANGNKMKQFLFTEKGQWLGAMKKWYSNGTLHYEQDINRSKDTCGYRTTYNYQNELVSQTFYLRDVMLLKRFYENGKQVKELVFHQDYHAWRFRDIATRDGITVRFKVLLGTYKGKLPNSERYFHDKILKKSKSGTIESTKNKDGSVSYFFGPYEAYEEAAQWAGIIEQMGKQDAQVVTLINDELIGAECF